MNIVAWALVVCALSWLMGCLYAFACDDSKKSKGRGFVCENLSLIQSALSCVLCVILVVLVVRGGMVSTHRAFV